MRKACAMPEWALIDAGGGAVVDLDAAGQEVLSQRKVDALRHRAVVVYIRVREGGRDAGAREGAARGRSAGAREAR